MKEVTKYQCEICHHVYNTEKEAGDCEAKGIPKKEDFPTGLMFIYSDNEKIAIYAVSNDGFCMGGHEFVVNLYRTFILTDKFDSFTNPFASVYLHSINQFKKDHYISGDITFNGAFGRMVSALKEKNITPSYYNEQGDLVQVK